MPQVLDLETVVGTPGAALAPAATTSSGGSRLAAIDVLRAVAALIILLRHGFWAHLQAPLEETGLYWLLYPITLGTPGVSLLLVVSGFCIHARAARSNPDRPPDFTVFWNRRLRRLYPPYVAAILLSAGVLAVVAAGKLSAAGHEVTGAALLASLAPDGLQRFALAIGAHLLFLFPLWHKAVWTFGNPVFWTLALEICLYLAYFGVPGLRKRLGMERTVLLALAVSVAWRFASTYGPIDVAGPIRSMQPVPDFPQTAWQQLIVGLTQMPARWFEWLLGALAAEVVYGTGSNRPLYRSIPLAVLAYAAALGCQWFRLGNVFTDLCWGMAGFVLLNRLIEAERNTEIAKLPAFRSMAWVGSWSYSLYLVHVPLLVLAHYVILPRVPGLVGLILSLAFAFAASYPFYRILELPALRWSRAASKRFPLDPATQPFRLVED